MTESITQEKKAVSEAVREVTEAMEELANNPDAPAGTKEELAEDVKFFKYMKEKLDSGFSWSRSKLRNLGRRIRDFAHACRDWLLRAYAAVVSALSRALAWLIKVVETALGALADVADRFIRVIFPSAEDKAAAQIEDINAAAVQAAQKVA